MWSPVMTGLKSVESGLISQKQMSSGATQVSSLAGAKPEMSQKEERERINEKHTKQSMA